MATLQDINTRIIARSNQLADQIKHAIAQISTPGVEKHISAPSKDVPSRPWMITGTTSLIVAGIGAMASDSKWPYLVGGLGVVLLGVGFFKRQQIAPTQEKKAISHIDIDEQKAFIIEKCNKLLDATKADWDGFMDTIKEEVQQLIQTSSIAEERKEEFLSFTYYPETLSLSALSLIDKLDAIHTNADFGTQIATIKTVFANEIASSIIKTANAQTNVYNNIKL